MNIVIVFSTTHNALAAEAKLKEGKVPFEMLPTPREITSSCGLSLRISESSLARILADVNASVIKVSAIYKVEGGTASEEKTYTEVWRR